MTTPPSRGGWSLTLFTHPFPLQPNSRRGGENEKILPLTVAVQGGGYTGGQEVILYFGDGRIWPYAYLLGDLILQSQFSADLQLLILVFTQPLGEAPVLARIKRMLNITLYGPTFALARAA